MVVHDVALRLSVNELITCGVRWGNDAQAGKPRLFSARRTSVRWSIEVTAAARGRDARVTKTLRLVL